VPAQAALERFPSVFERQGIFDNRAEMDHLNEVPISTSCARLGLNGPQTRYLDE
jgi:hypothetical protein